MGNQVAMPPVRLGLSLAAIDPDNEAELFVQTAIEAERAGFESVFVPDHVLHVDRGFADPLIVLAAIAASTSKIKIGTSVLVLPYRQPVLLANQLATLDRLSNGRLIVGVGVGWNNDEYAATGADPARRGQMTDEGLRVLRNLLAGGSTQGHRLGVAPTRPGGPPLWVGGHGEAALRRTATFADAWHGFNAEPAEVQSVRTQLAALAPDRNISLTTAIPKSALGDLGERVRRLHDAGAEFVVLQPEGSENPAGLYEAARSRLND
jgi:probable F420-dependent oxidoreductase